MRPADLVVCRMFEVFVTFVGSQSRTSTESWAECVDWLLVYMLAQCHSLYTSPADYTVVQQMKREVCRHTWEQSFSLVACLLQAA